MIIDCGRRLGQIRAEQFDAALSRFALGRFVQAEPVPFGLFGQNVFLRSTSGEYVLRGCPHYPWQFPKERFFARNLRDAALVPWPYLLDGSEDIFGWSYVLMPRMPGVHLSDPDVTDSLSYEDWIGIATSLGECLADMHAHVWPFPGEYDLHGDSLRRWPHGYASWVMSSFREILERARQHSDRTTGTDVAWVENVAVRASDALDGFAPSFVHHDFKPQNCTMQHDGSRWSVGGVLDLMESYVGDGEADLVRILTIFADVDRRLPGTFMDAYTSRRPLRPRASERLAFYMLVDRLVIWEYFQRPENSGVLDEFSSFREYAESSVALATGIV